ncbi:dephospho-CoA kinase/protein folding accessory domain-containing protein [Rubripirellula tenax]|uniref:Dephospho-CoA kinase/protein folding accessory domain-containing protein n=1 Tax=Rubripirellula tenax TaxID=2528015 RepID=A0A5C6F5N8_9BACT|nr:GrpB family protein [Rubripirellula tenax]TWU57023.1 dephospho-CoA kinase/protein folding accessory domain-containing protein [Rubripirellula tenax]
MHDEIVRLMHYDPRWRQEFEQTRSSILFSCEGWVTNVEHVGSTAISGLIARPTIDVFATVQDDEGIEPAGRLIEGLNFREQSTDDWNRDAITLIKPRSLSPETPEPTHRVWLVQESSPMLRRALRMRDHLRQHPESAIRYEEAKVACWKECDGDPQRYRYGKSIFIAHLIDQIDAADDAGGGHR